MAEEGGRKVGVAVDYSECSKKALRWALDNLLRNGDHLILIIVRPLDYESGQMQLWENSGSPLIPYNDYSDSKIMKKYGVVPDTESLELVKTIADEKQIVSLLKIFWGDPREKLCEAVDSIPLDSLVIGSRGVGPLKRMKILMEIYDSFEVSAFVKFLRKVFLGSVSNHVVNNVSCPVIVVH